MLKILYSLSVIAFSFCQEIPFIYSIEPAFGGIGSSIIISGENFSSNSQANILFFGGLKGNVLNSTENEIIVKIPNATYYTPISVYTDGIFFNFQSTLQCNI
jgi:hypothetical protein